MSLVTFINKYKSNNNGIISNIIIKNPDTYLNIPNCYYNNFLELYSKSTLNIVEIPSNLRQMEYQLILISSY